MNKEELLQFLRDNLKVETKLIDNGAISEIWCLETRIFLQHGLGESTEICSDRLHLSELKNKLEYVRGEND